MADGKASGAGGILTFILTVGLAAPVLAGAGSAGSWPTPTILSQSPNQVVVSVTLPAYSLENVEANGKTYARIATLGLAPFAREGQPDLPAIPVLLAIPPGGDARIVAVERRDQTYLDRVRIVPVAGFKGNQPADSQFPEYVYVENDSIYEGQAPFPRSAVWLTDKGRMRHQDVVRLMVAPFVYEPASGRVSVTRTFTITVAFESGGLLRGNVPAADPWEGNYRSAILNYDQGRAWRVAAEKQMGAVRPPGTQVTNARVKLTVAKTGLYRLS